MPRVEIKKKEYKILDFKGWVSKQMKLTGKCQYEVAEALDISPGRLSQMLKIPEVKDRNKKKCYIPAIIGQSYIIYLI